MNEEQVRKLIEEYLYRFIKTGKFVFDKDIQILDGRNIQTGKNNGTMIGTEGGLTGQKLGFFGKIPRVQGGFVGKASGGSVVDAEARQSINDLIAELEDLGIITE